MAVTAGERGVTVAQTASRNQCGRAIAMTLANPIHRGWAPLVRFSLALGRRFPAVLWGLRKLSFIHFAGFCVVERFPYNGPPQQKEQLQYDYLFFASNYNGYWMQYIDAFSRVVPRQMDLIWGHTYGYPKGAPAGPLKRVIRQVEVEYVASHYYSAYPEASATMVKAALEVKRRSDDFRASVEGTTPDEFQRAYNRFVTDVQRYL